jgi:K(+)-stimulated pyrophosphate-energized sodium pump
MVFFEPWIDLVALLSLGSSLIALAVAFLLAIIVLLAPAGNSEMKNISKAIRQGAIAFLTVEYISLSLFVFIMFVLISVLINWKTGVCYFLGSLCAAISGAIGMIISTYANTRTTAAAETSMSKALRVAFNSGSVMVRINVLIYNCMLGSFCCWMWTFWTLHHILDI